MPGFVFGVVLFVFAQVNSAQKGREFFAVTSFPHALILRCLAPSSGWYTRLGHTGTPEGRCAQGTGEFPVKHHHGMNSAVLPCCLWERRNPNQTSPRQAQHALKYRGCTSFGRRQAVPQSPLLLCPRVPPGWGTASPGVAPGTVAPARALGGQTAKAALRDSSAPSPDTGATPVSLRAKTYEKESILCVSKVTAISLTA